jgi:hypothetical protein
MKTPDGQHIRQRQSPGGIAFFEQRPAHMILAATGYDGVQRLVQATAFPLFGTNAVMHGVVGVFWEVSGAEGDA